MPLARCGMQQLVSQLAIMHWFVVLAFAPNVYSLGAHGVLGPAPTPLAGNRRSVQRTAGVPQLAAALVHSPVDQPLPPCLPAACSSTVLIWSTQAHTRPHLHNMRLNILTGWGCVWRRCSLLSASELWPLRCLRDLRWKARFCHPSVT